MGEDCACAEGGAGGIEKGREGAAERGVVGVLGEEEAVGADGFAEDCDCHWGFRKDGRGAHDG